MTADVATPELARAVRTVAVDPGPVFDTDALSQALKEHSNSQADSSLPGQTIRGLGGRIFKRDRATIVDTSAKDKMLASDGAESFELSVQLRMSHIPTSICHLFDCDTNPLVSGRAQRSRGAGSKTTRLRVTVAVDGYSATAIETMELTDDEPHSFDLLPTFYPDRLDEVKELTRATVSVLVEDLDGGRVRLHRTSAVWLLSRATALLTAFDPSTEDFRDVTKYFGTFVMPNDPIVRDFLGTVRDHHPDRRLVGGGSPSEVESQVQAAYEAVKGETDVTYVNNVLAFYPGDATAVQRVRLPRESIKEGAANCIDGVVLLASILEAISINPAIVVIPGHAFLGWESGEGSGDWRYLETTLMGTHSFREAVARGEDEAVFWSEKSKKDTPGAFIIWPLRQLRDEFGIMPMA